MNKLPPHTHISEPVQNFSPSGFSVRKWPDLLAFAMNTETEWQKQLS